MIRRAGPQSSSRARPPRFRHLARRAREVAAAVGSGPGARFPKIGKCARESRLACRHRLTGSRAALTEGESIPARTCEAAEDWAVRCAKPSSLHSLPTIDQSPRALPVCSPRLGTSSSLQARIVANSPRCCGRGGEKTGVDKDELLVQRMPGGAPGSRPPSSRST